MPDLTLQLPLASNPQQLIQTFVKDNKIQKEELRQYVLKTLTGIRQELEYYVFSPDWVQVWKRLADICILNGNITGQEAYHEIQRFPAILDYWIREAVSSPEMFEFFIVSKASELSTGDKDWDYYHALIIRNDQLLAVVQMSQEALSKLKQLQGYSLQDLMQSPHFRYFADKDCEKRIYEMAEDFYNLRVSLGILKG